jgi:hypothetical protein
LADPCHDYGVGEIFLLWVAAHIAEIDGLSGSGKAVAGASSGAVDGAGAVDAQQPGDVFQALLADILEARPILRHVLVDTCRHANPAGLGSPISGRLSGADGNTRPEFVKARPEHVV